MFTLTGRGWLVWGAVVAAGLAVGVLVDTPLYHAFDAFGEENDSELRDWNKLFWIAGFVPFWILVAAGIGLPAARRGARELARGAWTLLFACAVSGAAAYVLKLLLRRLRPSRADGEYVFRPYTEDFLRDSGLGLPSGHATLVFAAAFVMQRLFPEGRIVWYLLAVGCGLNRMVEGQHFFSDVWVGAWCGSMCAALVWARRHRVPSEPAP